MSPSKTSTISGWSGNETNRRVHLSYKKNVIHDCGIHVDPSSVLVHWLCRGCGTSCMVEGVEAAVVISSLRWKEVVRGKIRHRRCRGRGRSGLALIPLGWRELQRLPENWNSHVSTSRMDLKMLYFDCSYLVCLGKFNIPSLQSSLVSCPSQLQSN